MGEDIAAHARRPGVIHLHGGDRRRVVRQQVVIRHRRVAGDQRTRRESQSHHEGHECLGGGGVGEHERGCEVEEHGGQPGRRLERPGERVRDRALVVVDEGVAEPGQTHDADGGRHAGAEGVLTGDRRRGLARDEADDGGRGQHDRHDRRC